MTANIRKNLKSKIKARKTQIKGQKICPAPKMESSKG
jgi:hypothetical protein